MTPHYPPYGRRKSGAATSPKNDSAKQIGSKKSKKIKTPPLALGRAGPIADSGNTTTIEGVVVLPQRSDRRTDRAVKRARSAEHETEGAEEDGDMRMHMPPPPTSIHLPLLQETSQAGRQELG